MKNRIKKAFLVSSAILIMCSSISFADINVSRISGSDRYETAIKVNQKYIQKADGNLAIIASGNDFRTALYGSYMASALKVPFYVLPKDQAISKSVLNEFDRLNVKRVYIMGNNDVLSNKVDNEIKNKGVDVKRIKDQSENVNGYITYYSICDNIDGILFDQFFPKSSRGDNIAILVNDNKFPDLLSSTPLSAQLMRKYGYGVYSAKLLMERANNDSNEYYYPAQAYIIGGFDSVSKRFITESQYNDDSPRGDKRITGADRYKTAIEVAKSYKTELNININTIVIVNGKDYPDALSSGLVAAYNNGAILLTQPNELNKDTAEYIKTNTNIKNIIIVGGENSVSKNVENELKLLK